MSNLLKAIKNGRKGKFRRIDGGKMAFIRSSDGKIEKDYSAGTTSDAGFAADMGSAAPLYSTQTGVPKVIKDKKSPVISCDCTHKGLCKDDPSCGCNCSDRNSCTHIKSKVVKDAPAESAGPAGPPPTAPDSCPACGTSACPTCGQTMPPSPAARFQILAGGPLGRSFGYGEHNHAHKHKKSKKRHAVNKGWLPSKISQTDLDDGDFAWLSDDYKAGKQPKSEGRKLPYKIHGKVDARGWQAAWNAVNGARGGTNFEGGPSQEQVKDKLLKDKPAELSKSVDDSRTHALDELIAKLESRAG